MQSKTPNFFPLHFSFFLLIQKECSSSGMDGIPISSSPISPRSSKCCRFPRIESQTTSVRSLISSRVQINVISQMVSLFSTSWSNFYVCGLLWLLRPRSHYECMSITHLNHNGRYSLPYLKCHSIYSNHPLSGRSS